MTQKVYRTAMGKPVDMGALLLQNENVRAVGNMGVNARGDVIDSGNRVIERKNRQVQRQYQRSTNVSDQLVQTSNVALRRPAQDTPTNDQPMAPPVTQPASQPMAQAAPQPSVTEVVDIPTGQGGGLAAAIAKARAVQQTLETPLTKPKAGLKKI